MIKKSQLGLGRQIFLLSNLFFWCFLSGLNAQINIKIGEDHIEILNPNQHEVTTTELQQLDKLLKDVSKGYKEIQRFVIIDGQTYEVVNILGRGSYGTALEVLKDGERKVLKIFKETSIVGIDRKRNSARAQHKQLEILRGNGIKAPTSKLLPGNFLLEMEYIEGDKLLTYVDEIRIGLENYFDITYRENVKKIGQYFADLYEKKMIPIDSNILMNVIVNHRGEFFLVDPGGLGGKLGNIFSGIYQTYPDQDLLTNILLETYKKTNKLANSVRKKNGKFSGKIVVDFLSSDFFRDEMFEMEKFKINPGVVDYTDLMEADMQRLTMRKGFWRNINMIGTSPVLDNEFQTVLGALLKDEFGERFVDDVVKNVSVLNLKNFKDSLRGKISDKTWSKIDFILSRNKAGLTEHFGNAAAEYLGAVPITELQQLSLFEIERINHLHQTAITHGLEKALKENLFSKELFEYFEGLNLNDLSHAEKTYMDYVLKKIIDRIGPDDLLNEGSYMLKAFQKFGIGDFTQETVISFLEEAIGSSSDPKKIVTAMNALSLHGEYIPLSKIHKKVITSIENPKSRSAAIKFSKHYFKNGKSGLTEITQFLLKNYSKFSDTDKVLCMKSLEKAASLDENSTKLLGLGLRDQSPRVAIEAQRISAYFSREHGIGSGNFGKTPKAALRLLSPLGRCLSDKLELSEN